MNRGNRRRLGTVILGTLAIGLLFPWPSAAQVSAHAEDRPGYGHVIPSVPYERWVEVNYCGPACLSMVLNYWERKRPFDQKTIAAEVYDDARQGSNTSEMVLFPRLHGFASYSCQGDLETLRAVLRKNIPVIVLTKTPGQGGTGHYRVVIGFDDRQEIVIIHDPAFGAGRIMKVKTFLQSWDLGYGADKSGWMMAVVPEQTDFPFPALRENPMTHVNLATAYYRRDDFERSKSEWQRVRELSGRDPYPLYSLGIISLREGRPGEAEAYALKALSLDDKSAYAFDVLGLARAMQGRLSEAFRDLAQALRLAPKERSIRHHFLQVRTVYIANAGRAKDPDKDD